MSLFAKIFGRRNTAEPRPAADAAAADALFRHGDVMIQRVDSIPGQRQSLPHTVLARGEVTGHSHRIDTPDKAHLYIASSEMYLDVTGDDVNVVHEEHRPIALRQGHYRVWRQREYSPESIRIIQD